MMQSAPVLMLIVATSFGEVDWILPVLAAYKKKNPQWQIMTLFGHEEIFESLVHNRAIYEEFAAISSLNIVPREIDLFLSRNISPDQVKIILKDFNEDEYAPYKIYLESRCPDALVVSYPHSNYIYSNRTTEALQIAASPDAYSRHDIFLLGSEHDIPYWSSYVDVSKIRTFGYPVFDEGWMGKMLHAPSFVESPEMKMAVNAGKVFFHISRHPHRTYLDEEDYFYLMQSLVEEVFSYDDAVLLIKPHPRQNIDSFAEVLASYDPSRWMFTGLQLTQLCSLADVVVSFFSSGIINALAAGKPVIEFYRFNDKNPDWRRLPNGATTSIYRELGLAVPADSRQELALQIKSALAGTDSVWAFQQKAYTLHCQERENVAEAISDCLLKEWAAKKERVAKGEVSDEDKPARQLGYMRNFVEKGDYQAAEELVESLVGRYPNVALFYNELAVYLYQRGEVERAIRNFANCLGLDPHFGVAAVNLCHALMEKERDGEALEVILSFQRTVVEKQDVLVELQNALKGQLPAEMFDRLQKMLNDNHAS
ncbi:MAG: hypothetical protein KKC76_18500 [Proteobacteria bacterium]|nr:hypothetical protein [Pseudomonadota bacterium]MCG2748489.1 hypothetical protein [Desulfobulbaceae bacterium]